MITGLLDPTRGAVLFRGERIDADLTRFKQSLGYVPEQPDLYGFLTGWEYLELVATLRGLDRRRFREKASAMLQASPYTAAATCRSALIPRACGSASC